MSCTFPRGVPRRRFELGQLQLHAWLPDARCRLMVERHGYLGVRERELPAGVEDDPAQTFALQVHGAEVHDRSLGAAADVLALDAERDFDPGAHRLSAYVVCHGIHRQEDDVLYTIVPVPDVVEVAPEAQDELRLTMARRGVEKG